MTIALDVNSASTPQQLATQLQSANVAGQMTSSVATMETALQTVTSSAGSNCDMFGSIGGLIDGVAADLKAAYNEVMKTVQAAYASSMKFIGKIIKDIKSYAAAISAKINEFVTWLQSAAQSALGSAKSAVSDLMGVINEAIGAVGDAVSKIVASMTDMAKEFFSSLKNLSVKDCDGISGAVKDIGTGAGLDKAYAVCTSAAADAAASNMANVKSAMDAAKDKMAETNSTLSSAAGATGDISSKLSSIDAVMGK